MSLEEKIVSLEQAVNDNTATMLKLLEAMKVRNSWRMGEALAEQVSSALNEVQEMLETPETPVKPQPTGTVQSAVTEEAQPTEAVEKPSAEASPEPVALTYKDIQKPFLELVGKKGRDAAVALLSELGVKEGGKLTDVPESDWPKALAAIQKALV